MDLEIIILNEVRQKKKDKYHMISLIFGIQKSDTNELIWKKKKNRYTDIENKLMGKQRGEAVGWIN